MRSFSFSISKSLLCGSAILCWVSFAPATTWAAADHARSQQILKEIEKDLQNRRTVSFAPLLKNWEQRYGTDAVPPLMGMASNPKNLDANRYLALMGAAKLGGRPLASQVAKLLNDRSWMLRSGALQALSALDAKETGPAAMKLLRDPALVVRTEAVHTLVVLRPPGVEAALVRAILDQQNYHGGKAQWVPQAALEGLVTLKAESSVPQLRALLDHKNDRELLESTVSALEKLTGKSLAPEGTLTARVDRWKESLN